MIFWVVRILLLATIAYIIYGAVSGRLRGWKPALILIGCIIAAIVVQILPAIIEEQSKPPTDRELRIDKMEAAMKYECEFDIGDDAAHIMVKNTGDRYEQPCYIRATWYGSDTPFYCNGKKIDKNADNRCQVDFTIPKNEREKFVIQLIDRGGNTGGFTIYVNGGRRSWAFDLNEADTSRIMTETYKCDFNISGNAAHIVVKNIERDDEQVLSVRVESQEHIPVQFYCNGEKGYKVEFTVPKNEEKEFTIQLIDTADKGQGCFIYVHSSTRTWVFNVDDVSQIVVDK